MSASATLATQVRYKDQLKLNRAETLVSWLAAAFDRVVGALKIEPAAVAAKEETATPGRYYGAFHC
jgi:hypothetical protein